MKKRTLLSAVVLIVVGVFSSTVLAGGPLGPPGATLAQGQWTVDAGYFYEDFDLYGSDWVTARGRSADVNVVDETYEWNDWSDPNTASSYFGSSLTLKDFTTNTWLASFDYGLWESCTIYVRAGMADAEADATFRSWQYDEDEGAYAWYDFGGSAEFDYGFAWQVGTSFTIYQSGPWTLGGRMQFGMANPEDYSFSGTEESATDPNDYDTESGSVDLEWWQAVALLGGSYQVNDALSMYCSGGWQTFQGTVDFSMTDTSYEDELPTSQYQYTSSYKIKHASAIGVFGVGFQPTDNVHVCGEVLVGEAGKWGIGLTGAFAVP